MSYIVRTVPKYQFYSVCELGESSSEEGRGAAAMLISLDNACQVPWWREAKEREPKPELLQ